LLAVVDTLEVEVTADDVVTDTREVFYSTASYEHNGVLLQVVTLTTYVSPNLVAVAEADAGHLA
jgi:hypothetical protein